MVHCKQFYYLLTMSTLLITGWLNAVHWNKEGACVMFVCVHWCIGVYIHMQAHNESLRLIPCAADFIFRKAVTFLFVPKLISHLSLSKSTSFSVLDCPQSEWRIWREQDPGCRPEHTAANQSLPCWAPAARHLYGNWAALALWLYDGIAPSLHWKRQKKERNKKNILVESINQVW